MPYKHARTHSTFDLPVAGYLAQMIPRIFVTHLHFWIISTMWVMLKLLDGAGPTDI